MQLVYQAPAATWASDAIAVLTMGALFFTTFLYPLAVPLLVGGMFYGHDARLLAFVVVVVSSLLWATERAAHLTWVGEAVADSWRRYFGLRVYRDSNSAYAEFESLILSGHPHGYFPMALPCMAGISHLLLPSKRLSATSPPRTAIASAMFSLPLLAPLLVWLGCIPANRAEMRSALMDEASSNACVVFPDGIAGIFHSLDAPHNNEEHLYLQHRRGFVQLALETKSALVPFYCFGQAQLFSLLWPMRGANGWAARISRRWRFCLALVSWPMPMRRRLVVAVSSPVRFSGSETIQQAHTTYLSHIESLFNRAKHLAGKDYAQKQLYIT